MDIEQTQDLMKLIQMKFPRLSKGQKLIADFILKNYDKAAFMTAAKLGDSVGVSESTVVRFAIELGFSGYPKLQKALQELIKNKLTSVQRLELSNDYAGDENVLRGVLKSDIENLRTTLEKISQENFNAVIDEIFKAKTVYIVGLRSSSAIAEFLGFYLRLIIKDVRVVAHNISNIFEQMINCGEGDLVIGIGFPRYALRTINGLEFAKQRNAKVVAITDSNVSPLATVADYALIAQSNMASFVDSLVAPLSVINALIVAVGVREKDKITSTFYELEELWKNYDIYSYNQNNIER